MGEIRIQDLRSMIDANSVLWQKHCLERMQERGIGVADVLHAIEVGEVIEDYPKDFPHPSCLVLGASETGRPLHVVVGSDGNRAYMITAYKPNTEVFEADLKTRRSR